MIRRLLLLLAILAIAAASRPAAVQQSDLEVGIVDVYGLVHVSDEQVRAALALKEGDRVGLVSEAMFDAIMESKRRLMALSGVADADLSPVCCAEGRLIVFAGIQEVGRPALHFRAKPSGAVRLPDDVVAAGKAHWDAFSAAIQRGDTREDDSQGHALSDDPATRTIQLSFIAYAARDRQLLRRVLRESSDDADRALAAMVLGYVQDKQAVVNDLVSAMADPSANVRNNAMRALLVFSEMKPVAGQAGIRVPHEPFVAMLHSVVWTDRNKSCGALSQLTRRRDAALLDLLRRNELRSLVEMARWKSAGHAEDALVILGRIAGRSDEDSRAALAAGDRETIIRAALARR